MTVTSTPAKAKASFTPELFAFLARPSGQQQPRVVRGEQGTTTGRAARAGARLRRRLRAMRREDQPAPARRAAAVGRLAVPDLPRHPLLEGQDAVQDERRHPLPPRAAKDAYAPGFYLHLGGARSSPAAASGILTRPRPRIREAIVADPDGWQRATHTRAFAKTHPGRRLAEAAVRPGSTPPTRSWTT